MAVRSPEERRFLLPLALIAFSLKAVLVPIYYIVLVKGGLDGFAYIDSYSYHLDGIEIARELRYGIDYSSRAWRAVDPGYPIFTGIVYWIAGPNTLVVRILNCVFSTFMLLYIYRIARLFFEEERIARWACYLVAFLPYSTTIVINHRKEPIVTLLATFIFFHTARLIRSEKNSSVSAALAVSGLVAMIFFRSGFVLPFMGVLFLCYVTATQSLVRSLALAIPTILAMVTVEFLLADDVSVSVVASTERIRGKILDSAGHAQVGGLVRFVRMTSIYEIYKLPLATILVVILPYPPHVNGNLPSIILSWENLLNLAFLPQVIRGAWMVLSEAGWQKRIPLLIFPGVFLVLIGATHVGVERYREVVFPVMMVLGAAGLYRGRNLRLSIVVYGALIVLGGVVVFSRFA